MRTKVLKKLYHGLGTLRDYDAMEFMKEGGVIIVYGGKKMTLTASMLQDITFQCHGKRYTSQIPGWKNPIDGTNTYAFIDFKFVPDNAPKQEELPL